MPASFDLPSPSVSRAEPQLGSAVKSSPASALGSGSKPGSSPSSSSSSAALKPTAEPPLGHLILLRSPEQPRYLAGVLRDMGLPDPRRATAKLSQPAAQEIVAHLYGYTGWHQMLRQIDQRASFIRRAELARQSALDSAAKLADQSPADRSPGAEAGLAVSVDMALAELLAGWPPEALAAWPPVALPDNCISLAELSERFVSQLLVLTHDLNIEPVVATEILKRLDPTGWIFDAHELAGPDIAALIATLQTIAALPDDSEELWAGVSLIAGFVLQDVYPPVYAAFLPVLEAISTAQQRRLDGLPPAERLADGDGSRFIETVPAHGYFAMRSIATMLQAFATTLRGCLLLRGDPDFAAVLDGAKLLQRQWYDDPLLPFLKTKPYQGGGYTYPSWPAMRTALRRYQSLALSDFYSGNFGDTEADEPRQFYWKIQAADHGCDRSAVTLACQLLLQLKQPFYNEDMLRYGSFDRRSVQFLTAALHYFDQVYPRRHALQRGLQALFLMGMSETEVMLGIPLDQSHFDQLLAEAQALGLPHKALMMLRQDYFEVMLRNRFCDALDSIETRDGRLCDAQADIVFAPFCAPDAAPDAASAAAMAAHAAAMAAHAALGRHDLDTLRPPQGCFAQLASRLADRLALRLASQTDAPSPDLWQDDVHQLLHEAVDWQDDHPAVPGGGRYWQPGWPRPQVHIADAAIPARVCRILIDAGGLSRRKAAWVTARLYGFLSWQHLQTVIAAAIASLPADAVATDTQSEAQSEAVPSQPSFTVTWLQRAALPDVASKLASISEPASIRASLEADWAWRLALHDYQSCVLYEAMALPEGSVDAWLYRLDCLGEWASKPSSDSATSEPGQAPVQTPPQPSIFEAASERLMRHLARPVFERLQLDATVDGDKRHQDVLAAPRYWRDLQPDVLLGFLRDNLEWLLINENPAELRHGGKIASVVDDQFLAWPIYQSKLYYDPREVGYVLGDRDMRVLEAEIEAELAHEQADLPPDQRRAVIVASRLATTACLLDPADLAVLAAADPEAAAYLWPDGDLRIGPSQRSQKPASKSAAKTPPGGVAGEDRLLVVYGGRLFAHGEWHDFLIRDSAHPHAARFADCLSQIGCLKHGIVPPALWLQYGQLQPSVAPDNKGEKALAASGTTSSFLTSGSGLSLDDLDVVLPAASSSVYLHVRLLRRFWAAALAPGKESLSAGQFKAPLAAAKQLRLHDMYPHLYMQFALARSWRITSLFYELDDETDDAAFLSAKDLR